MHSHYLFYIYLHACIQINVKSFKKQDAIILLLLASVAKVTETKDRKMPNRCKFKVI